MIDNNIKQIAKLKYSKTAIASMVLGIAAFCGLTIFTAIPGLILGIISLIKIKKFSYLIKGKGLAITGVLVSAANIILFTLLVSGIIYSIIHDGHLHPIKPEMPLKAGRLADLPYSATNIKAEGWSGGFSGTEYLMFKAAHEDIEKFITESKSLDTPPEIFGVNHQYLQTEPNDKIWQTEEYCKNKYFLRNYWPQWFDPTIKKNGRIYKIPAENSHNWGEIIINDETHTVYIWVCWS